MLFNTFDFLLFFIVVYALYLLLPFRAQNVMLLVASYFFYGCWDWRFLGLILASTLIDFTVGRRLPRAQGRARRRWLMLSLCGNLGLLGFFKYFNFFVDSAQDLLAACGWHPEVWHLEIVLPVGISFYTFQTLSYTIDIYRGKIEPIDSILDFALFVAFFPQLVAGPIERAGRLIPQIVRPRVVDAARVREGLFLILGGLFKKMFIADNCAVIVDRIYGSASGATGAEWLLATYAFAIQVYCDFSGYSDVARGLGKMMGFDIMLNFNLPYFATSPSDLWRRWHISLSSWLRDYLYVPLGGNRKGEVRTNLNLMITMVLGGLWHGASWNMALWGFQQGAVLVLYRFVAKMPRFAVLDRPEAMSPAARLVAIVVQFHQFCFGLLIFRSTSIAQFWEGLTAIVTRFSWDAEAASVLGRLALLTLPLAAIQVAQYVRSDLRFVMKLSPLARTGVVMAILLTLSLHWILYGQGFKAGEEFIYFQF